MITNATRTKSRFFHTTDGWFVVLRSSDENFSPRAEIGGADSPPVAGPFITRERMEEWFEWLRKVAL